MAKIVATVYEETAERAAAEAVGVAARADAVEIRLDGFSRPGEAVDLGAFRRACAKPLIATRRGGLAPGEAEAALAAGFSLVDVDYRPGLAPSSIASLLDRTILSFHDFESVPELRPLVAAMQAFGAAEVKIAATPRTLGGNLELLRLLDGTVPNLTVLGMGDRGLYARILAPLLGSSLAFVAARGDAPGAPGQFDLERGRAIWGEGPAVRRAEAIFAVVGNPASHSESPRIHNARFRASGLPAAYTIAEVEEFEEIAEAMWGGEPLAPRGVSITAPFKEEAFRAAGARGARVSARAAACGAVNTLVRMPDGGFVAENTDVEGIGRPIDRFGRAAARAAVIGAGGTARAAIVALRERGIPTRVYARSAAALERLRRDLGAEVAPLGELSRFEGDLVVNTISAGAVVPYPPAVLRRGGMIVDAAYGGGRAVQQEESRAAGASVAGGLEVLEAQADAQSELFFLSMGRRATASEGVEVMKEEERVQR